MFLSGDPELRLTAATRQNRSLFELLAPVSYRTRDGDLITVPAGFVTDLTSAPMWLGINYAHRAKAAIIHDWLIETRLATRKEADRIFRQALQDLGMGWAERSLYWVAVRASGILTKNRSRA